MSFKKITAAVMMAGAATGASAAELIITLEEGVDSVGKQVDYAEFERRSGDMEIVSVGDDEVEASIALLKQRSEVRAVERNVTMSAPEPDSEPFVQATSTYDDAEQDASFNDPLFSQQYSWREYSDDAPGGSTVTKAVTQAKVYEPVNVVVIDGGFTGEGAFQWEDGYNFIDDSDQDGGLAIGETFRTTVDQCESHGQQVASVMGGVPNDGQGNTGVLENANFYAARVLDCEDLAGGGDRTVEAIRWAAGATDTSAPALPEPADVINLSLSAGQDCPSELQSAIDEANAEGAIVTVSAGNTTEWGNEGGNDLADDNSPANCDGVVTVTGTDQQGAPGGFSTGSVVDVSAAGVQIPAYAGNTAYTVSGTSFSAPLVGAIVANLVQDVPGIDNATIRNTIIPNAVNPVSNPDDQTLKMGEGLIDAHKLQQAAVDAIDPPDFDLRHPAGGDCGGTQMLNALAEEQGNDVCDLREVRVNTDLEANGKHAVIFEVPDGGEMTVSNATKVQASQAERFMINDWDESKQYGIQKCDSADGTGCSDEALIPLDMDDVQTQCST